MKSSRTVACFLLGMTAFAFGCSSENDSNGVGAGEQDVVARKGAPIDALTYLSIDEGGSVNFNYSIGGGCADHKAASNIELTKKGPTFAGKLQVSDVASEFDACEGLLNMTGTANLHALLSTAAKESKAAVPPGSELSLEVPSISLDVGAATASAPEPEGAPIDALRAITLDNTTGDFSFTYSRGGGCADHKAATSVELIDRGELSLVAKVKISDVANDDDPCEALISVSGKANLKALIVGAAKKSGADVSGVTLTVELPPVVLVTR